MRKDELIIVGSFDSARGNFGVHAGVAETAKAEYAKKLADHFSIIAAIPDGEDSAGRSKLRLATPEECATRACAISEAMYSEFEKRDWLIEVPSFDELTQIHRQKADEEESAREKRRNARGKAAP